MKLAMTASVLLFLKVSILVCILAKNGEVGKQKTQWACFLSFSFVSFDKFCFFGNALEMIDLIDD